MGQYTSALGFGNNKLYSTLFEGQFPVAKSSNMTWVGFSEEGLLATLSIDGVLSALNFKNNQWVPILDLSDTYPDTFSNFWVVGLMETELVAIEMPNDCDTPPLSMKNVYKRIEYSVPLLTQEGVEGDKTQDLHQKDEKFIRG